MILLALSLRAEPLAEWPLESGDGGFVVSGETEQWEWGAVENGPGSGFDGANAWAAGLRADYLNDATDYLEIPIPDLGAADYPVLVFSHWFAIEAGDVAWVETDAGNGWSRRTPLYGYPTAEGWTGSSRGWERVGVDLSGLGPTPGVRLVFASDVSGVDDGWFIDDVGVYDGDVTPPKVSALLQLPDTEDLSGPYVVAVTAEDDVAVDTVAIVFSVDGGTETTTWASFDGATWLADLPGQAADTVVAYRAVVSDGLNETTEPPTGELSFRVYLPAPTDLTGPAGRVVDDVAALAWTAPVSVHPVEAYRVYRDEVQVAEVAGTEATVPLVDGLDSFVVRAVYDVGEGDASAPVTVDAAVPAIRTLDPAEGYPGEQLRVELIGANLLMVDGEVEVDLGEGVETVGVEVADVDRVVVTVQIAETAAEGARDVVVETVDHTTRAAAAFSVRAAADAPHLAGLSPERARQGETVSLHLQVVGPLAGLSPRVDLGEGVVVEDAVVEGDEVVATVSFAANCPLGAHAITVDDGVRVFEGVSVEVEDVLVTDPGPCGCGGGAGRGAPGALLLALAAAAGRRRGSGPVSRGGHKE